MNLEDKLYKLQIAIADIEDIKNDLVDYLILGNHYLKYDVNTGNFTVCDYPDTSKQYVLQYLDSSIEALSSGLFKIFAHPDYFMSYYDDFDDGGHAH